jgi:DNA-binding CsgD family transcriptional regulator
MVKSIVICNLDVLHEAQLWVETVFHDETKHSTKVECIQHVDLKESPNYHAIFVYHTDVASVENNHFFYTLCKSSECPVYFCVQTLDSLSYSRLIQVATLGYKGIVDGYDYHFFSTQSLIKSKHSDFYVSHTIVKKTLLRSIEEYKKLSKLTKNELNILKLVCSGMSYNEIAESMVLSIDGVRYYMRKLFSKLGVNTKYELLKLAWFLID